MGKNPAFQFYPKDWLSDRQLRTASFEVKGIWIDMLSLMWFEPKRGVLSGTAREMSRALGATEDELANFLAAARHLGFCDVTERNGCVTVVNRRMVREEKEREMTRLRVSRYREKEQCNADVRTSNGDVTGGVTPMKHHSPSPSPKDASPKAPTAIQNQPPLPPASVGNEGGSEATPEKTRKKRDASTCNAPYQAIADIYNETCCPPLPRCIKLAPGQIRYRNITARWKEYPDLEQWRHVATKLADVSKSNTFYTGDNDRCFVADLEYMTRSKTFTKYLEGAVFVRKPGDLFHDNPDLDTEVVGHATYASRNGSVDPGWERVRRSSTEGSMIFYSSIAYPFEEPRRMQQPEFLKVYRREVASGT